MNTITVTYIPLIRGNTSHTKIFNLTVEAMYGFIVMAGILSSPERMQIILSGGDTVDITRYSELTHIGTRYTAKFKEHNTAFDNIAFVDGGVQVCLLLGIDPSSIITSTTTIDRYIAMIEIPNFSGYSNGNVIHINDLDKIIDARLLKSMKLGFQQCFPQNIGIGIVVPSTTYMITTDARKTQVAAIAMITPYNSDSLNSYNNLQAHSIFNVCSSIPQQGLAKSVLIALINNSIANGINSFILEVLPSNTVAKSLYSSLGFIKVGTSQAGTSAFDVMLLNFKAI